MKEHALISRRKGAGGPARLCAPLLLAAAAATPARAVTCTWTGGAAPSRAWSQDANWAGAAAVSAADTDLIFAGTAQTIADNDVASPFLLRNLTFDSSAGAFTLSGFPLALHGNVGNNSAASQTIANDVVLCADSQWNAAAGDIVLAGDLSNAGNFTLKKSGARALVLAGRNVIRLADKGIAGGVLSVAGGATTNQANGNLMATSGGNALVVTNGATFATTVGATVDNGGNTLVVAGEGSTFSGCGTSFLYLNTDARLVLADNAVVTNVTDFRIGDSGKDRITVIVTNGAHLCSSQATYRGTRSSSVWVGGAGAAGAPAPPGRRRAGRFSTQETRSAESTTTASATSSPWPATAFSPSWAASTWAMPTTEKERATA